MEGRDRLRPRGARWAFAAGAVAVAIAGGCGGGGSPTAPGPVASATPTPAAPSLAACFDSTVLHETRLELDPAAWQSLRDHYLTNQYYAANLTVDGTFVPQVGVRSRGAGSRDEAKPGLKIDVNKYVAGQEVFGYKSLVLDNFRQDPSLLREHLAFQVFEAMGIPAPANAFTRLVVNGEYWGLYGLVEPVSKPFLEARLGDDGGNLFDYEWAFEWDLSWRGSDPAAYVPVPLQPQTHEDDPNVGVGVVSLVRAINESPASRYATALAEMLDVDRLLTYVAVENAIAEGDGFVGDFGVNNFYLYQYGGQTRFVLIPWDKDTSFIAAAWSLYRNVDSVVLVDRLLDDPARRKVYVDAVVRAVSSYVNERWLVPRLDSAWALVQRAAFEDEKKRWSNDATLNAVGGLRDVIARREADVLSQTGRRP